MNQNELDQLLELTKVLKFGNFILLAIAWSLIFFLVKLIKKLSDQLQTLFPLKRFLVLQITTVINFVIYLVGGGFVTFVILKPPRELLIALAGSAAVAIGFALKDLVGSFIAGLVILFDRPFQVGDRVNFGGHYGEIKTIGLRAVRLATLDDNLITIPNTLLLTDTVSSGNAGELDMMVTVDFYIDLNADIQKAKDLLYEIIVTSRFVYLMKPAKVIVSEEIIANQVVLMLKAKAYVLDTQYEKDFTSDLVTRTNNIFNINKIPRPKIPNFLSTVKK